MPGIIGWVSTADSSPRTPAAATVEAPSRRSIGFAVFLIVTGAVGWWGAMQLITERVRPDEVGVTETLLRFIHDENIHLIVAGAYGHSRLGEWAFGGATRGLLAESPICCLFSH